MRLLRVERGVLGEGRHVIDVGELLVVLPLWHLYERRQWLRAKSTCGMCIFVDAVSGVFVSDVHWPGPPFTFISDGNV